MSRFYLCGFMGAGKTTLLGEMAHEWPAGYRFFDLDQELVATEEGASISRLVEKVGWEEFRRRESALLSRLSVENFNLVMALGGGAYHEQNRQLITSLSGVAIWLDTPFDTCYARIRNDPQRPLVGKGEIFLRQLYLERSGDYRQAEIRLDMDRSGSSLQHLLALLKLDEVSGIGHTYS